MSRIRMTIGTQRHDIKERKTEVEEKAQPNAARIRMFQSSFGNAQTLTCVIGSSPNREMKRRALHSAMAEKRNKVPVDSAGKCETNLAYL